MNLFSSNHTQLGNVSFGEGKQITKSELDNESIDILPILLAQQLVLFPLYFFIPLWVTSLNLVIASFIAVSALKQRKNAARRPILIPVWLKVIITLAAAAGVLATFHKFAGRDAGVALIATMYGLKMLEIKKKRDVYIEMILGFFLLLSGFLFDQSPWIAFYQFIAVGAILNALMALNSLHRNAGIINQSLPKTLRKLLKYLLLALPIMIVLFVFFPRLSGPIWKMPGGSNASSGISDTMSPGEISNLQLFDKVAFRVKFTGDEPVGNELYWRTLVLDEFDGLTWSRDSRFSKGITSAKMLSSNNSSGKADAVNPNPNPDHTAFVRLNNTNQELAIGGNSGNYRYEISLEKTQLQWLTLLDRPIAIPARSQKSSDYSVQVEHRIVDRTRYSGISQPKLKLDVALSEASRRHHVSLPRSGNSRTRQWAQENRVKFENDREFIMSVLSRINRKEYFYTLSPPIMTEETVDSFWLDEQRGFCEHYSSALVYIARAANIPARVVVGYQGAEKNSLSDYWIVRYANAHAWTEIWLEGEGWVRVDPTAAIAQHRVEEQLQMDYSQRDSLFEEFGFDAVDLSELGWTKKFQYWMDQANTGWNDWVLDYNRQAQQKLFNGLGLEKLSIKEISLLMMATVFAFLGLISFNWVKSRQHIEPIEVAFNLLTSKLASNGIVVDSQQGASSLISKVQESRVSSSANSSTATDDIVTLLKRYVFLRYSQTSLSIEQQQQFLKQVKRLRIT